MSEVPRKRYRRESLEEDKKLTDESDDEELYIPLKERRKLQFSALEQNQGNNVTATNNWNCTDCVKGTIPARLWKKVYGSLAEHGC